MSQYIERVSFSNTATLLSTIGYIFITHMHMVNGNHSLIPSIDVYLVGIPRPDENKIVEEGGGEEL